MGYLSLVMYCGISCCKAGFPYVGCFSCEALASAMQSGYTLCGRAVQLMPSFQTTLLRPAGAKLCARLCFVKNRASRRATRGWRAKRALRLYAAWKARSSTQHWPAIVLLARLASETGQPAFSSII